MQFICKIRAFVLCLCIALCVALACGAGPAAAAANEPNPYDAPMPSFSTPVTYEEIRLAYYQYSAVSIVKALHLNNAANWNMILGKVQEGDEKWIQALLAYISPGTDAGASTEVLVSLALALPNNPKAILALAYRPGPPLYQICRTPFIEPEYDFIADYGKRALAALERVDEKYYLEPRDICSTILQDSLDHLKGIYEKGGWGR